MLQRLGLAQAMLHDPELFILDEPTDGLDPLARSQVRGYLTDLKRQGKTIFLNSHILQEVELICDRVAILDKGVLCNASPTSPRSRPAASPRRRRRQRPAARRAGRAGAAPGPDRQRGRDPPDAGRPADRHLAAVLAPPIFASSPACRTSPPSMS